MKLFRSPFFMSFLGLVLPRVSTLLAYIAASRNLAAEEFGYYAYIQSTIVTAGLISALGLSQVVTGLFAKSIGEHDPKSRAELLTLLRCITLISVVVTIGAIAILFSLAQINGLELAATALSLTGMLFITREAIFSAGLIGIKDLRGVAINGILSTIVTISATAILTYSFGLIGGLISLFLTYFFSALLAELKLRRRFALNSTRRGNKAASPKMNVWLHLNTTAPSLLAYTAVAATFWGSQTLVVAHEKSFIAITILAVARQWLQAVQMVPGTLSRVFLPAMAEARSKQPQLTLLRQNLAINTTVTLFILFVLLVLSGAILALYEIRGATVKYVFSIFLVSGAVAAISDPIGQYLIAVRRIWTVATLNLAWAASFWLVFIVVGKFTAESNSEALLASYGILLILSLGALSGTIRKASE